MVLKKGDTIGIVATSGPFDLKRFEKGIEILESFGFKTKIPEAVYERYGYLAGPDNLRADTLEKMFLDDEVNVIFCARGGFGATRIIDRIDYELIKANPKPFIGFSDVTALLLSLNERSGIKTFHGPVITSLENLEKNNLEQIFHILSLEEKETFKIKPYEPYVINEGSSKGYLTGGNLCMLSHMIGTDFEPDFRGKILFLEDVNEPLYKIDRMMTHLFLSGKLDGLNGVVLGDFKDCGEKEDLYALFRERFSNLNIPVLAGMGFGHGNRNELIPVGSEAFLSTYDASMEIRL